MLSSHDLVESVSRQLDAIPYRTSAPFGALHDLTLAVVERVETAARQQLNGAESSPSSVSTEPKLRELITLLKGQGVDVRLCLHLTVTELISPSELPVLEQLTRLSTDSETPLVVTKAAYKEAQSRGHIVHHDDIHLSSAGAEALAELLSAEGARGARAK